MVMTSRLGDVNGDAAVDGADASKLARVVVGLDEAASIDALSADVDQDGRLTVLDVVRTARAAVGKDAIEEWAGWERAADYAPEWYRSLFDEFDTGFDPTAMAIKVFVPKGVDLTTPKDVVVFAHGGFGTTLEIPVRALLQGSKTMHEVLQTTGVRSVLIDDVDDGHATPEHEGFAWKRAFGIAW
jgi:hypothetical protein